MNPASSRVYTIIALLALTVRFSLVEAYEDPTHRALADRAVDVSSLDAYLRGNLGFPDGNNSRLLELSIRQRISNGALTEDVPETRVLYHFHNPLRPPWSEAGLRVGIQLGESSGQI